MQFAFSAKLIPKRNSDDPGTRYGFNVHNTRDLVISHLTEVPGLKDVCVEYWAGHQIDPLGYRDLKLKPTFVEEQYRLAIPYLNIFTPAENERTKNLEEKIEQLEFVVKMLQDASGLKLQRNEPAAGENAR